MPSRLLIVAAAVCALLVACGGDAKRGILQPESLTPSPVPTAKPYVFDEAPTPAGPMGRVTTKLTGTCKLSTVDSEINAVYGASVVGPNSMLRRVRLMVNNKVADDSGDIFTQSYETSTRVHVSSGANYNLVVAYIVTNAAGPQVINIVRCPPSPGPAA